ncbi:MAG: (d)CMP kinase [Acidobacteriales bacterium]|nr:(d)CMP kinase [Terriglobales bacterium]
MARRKLVIAIDGPAGAGKSTLAAKLARHNDYLNIETGAMYRALALKAIENDVSLEDENALLTLANSSRIQLQPSVEGNRVLLDTVNVSSRVRERDVTEAASRVSVHPRVRAWMVEQQRAMGQAGGVVMEGRDIGTVVFPDADLKIFLDAAPEVRGSRRYRQVTTSAAAVANAEAITNEMRERDERDRARSVSPLVPASDAVVIDSSSLTLEDVVDRAQSLIDAKLKC